MLLNNIKKSFKVLKKNINLFLTNITKFMFNWGVVNIKNEGVINFIDVGAIGELPAPWFRNSKSINVLLRFEPRESSKIKKNVITIDAALWDKEEIRNFYLYKGNFSHGSSLFKQNYSYVKQNYEVLKLKGSISLSESWFERSELIGTKQLKCKTLDNIMADFDIEFDFLKIDAQGAEYQILRGANQFLIDSCIALQLELFNIPIYEDIVLKDDVIRYLDSLGFELAKEFPLHGTFYCANDCLFLRRDIPESKADKLALIKRIYNIK